MKYCFYQKRKVAYHKVGKGDVLVFLHGFCEDSTMWADFVQVFQKKYNVLTIDLSGFGASDLLLETSIVVMAKAVNAVLEALNISKCCIIGHSMGGYVGLAFAELFEAKLSGLGLFHSHPYEDSDAKKANRLKTVRFIERHGVAPFASQFVRRLFTKSFVKENREYIEDLIQKTTEYHSDAVIAASKAMVDRADKTRVLASLTCPVLYIIGEKDIFIDYAQSLEQTTFSANGSIHILKDIGHMGMVEAKDQTLAIIDQFMQYLAIRN